MPYPKPVLTKFDELNGYAMVQLGSINIGIECQPYTLYHPYPDSILPL